MTIGGSACHSKITMVTSISVIFSITWYCLWSKCEPEKQSFTISYKCERVKRACESRRTKGTAELEPVGVVGCTLTKVSDSRLLLILNHSSLIRIRGANLQCWKAAGFTKRMLGGSRDLSPCCCDGCILNSKFKIKCFVEREVYLTPGILQSKDETLSPQRCGICATSLAFCWSYPGQSYRSLSQTSCFRLTTRQRNDIQHQGDLWIQGDLLGQCLSSCPDAS